MTIEEFALIFAFVGLIFVLAVGWYGLREGLPWALMWTATFLAGLGLALLERRER